MGYQTRIDTFGEATPEHLCDMRNIVTAFDDVRDALITLETMVDGDNHYTFVMDAIRRRIMQILTVARILAADDDPKLQPLKQALVEAGYEVPGADSVPSRSMLSVAHPEIREWDKSDSVIAANQEGWDLFNVGGRLELWALHRPDLNGKRPFASNADAIAYVAYRAITGSSFHARALAAIGKIG